jgi:hypothetical protein
MRQTAWQREPFDEHPKPIALALRCCFQLLLNRWEEVVLEPNSVKIFLMLSDPVLQVNRWWVCVLEMCPEMDPASAREHELLARSRPQKHSNPQEWRRPEQLGHPSVLATLGEAGATTRSHPLTARLQREKRRN